MQSDGSPFPAGKSPNDIALSDFDEDGKLDLAFPNHETDYLTVLMGDGTGRFLRRTQTTVQSKPHPHGIAAGDFDGDGHLDLAVESWRDDQIEIFAGDGRGSFAEPGRLFSTGRMPYQKLRSADFNNDGKADIVTTNMRENSVSVLLGEENGTLNHADSSPIAVSRSPFAVAIGDVNSDQNLDLAIVHYSGSIRNASDDGLSILLGDGTGNFQPAGDSPFRTGAAPVAVAIGDINGDGVAEIAVANLGSSDVTIVGNRSGVFRPEKNSVRVGRGPSGIALGDLNHDRKAEIVVANSDDGNIAVVFSK